jgi:hypothetical protein
MYFYRFARYFVNTMVEKFFGWGLGKPFFSKRVSPRKFHSHSAGLNPRRRRALETTQTLEKDMAAAAIIGVRAMPNAG